MISTSQNVDRKLMFWVKVKKTLLTKLSIAKTIFDTPIICNSLRVAVFCGVLLLIIQKLSQIGWSEVYAARPSSPLFYVLAIGLFLVPITVDMLACRMITASKIPNWFKVFSRKHIYNEAILSYTGEAYLVKKIAALPNFDLRRAAIVIKDQALIRTFVSNAWLIVLVLLVVFAGQSAVLMDYALISPESVGFIGALCIGLCTLLIVFFRKLSRLSMAVSIKVAGIYLLKAIAILSIHISQWSLAIPGTQISTWFVFLVIFALTKKSPFSGELIFVSVILTIPGLGLDSAAVAAMLITATAINQFIFLIMFLVTSELEIPFRPKAVPSLVQ